jgi:putative oxidoreductase
MTATYLPAPVQRVLSTLNAVPFDVLILFPRAATFSVFIHSGLQKLSDWNATLMLFHDEYKVPILPPAFAAYMAASMELGLSTLVLIGFLSRLSAVGLLGMVSVIQIFVYPDAWPDHIQWLAFMIFIVCRGPGAFSLDAAISKLLARRAAASGTPAVERG